MSISYVRDKFTGNYCSENSFIYNKEGTEEQWIYITCTGNNIERTITGYIKNRAEEVLNKLNNINNAIKANKEFYIEECINIPFGEVVIEVIKN